MNGTHCFQIGKLGQFFFVICLFLLVHRRYNIKEVNLLITVYSRTVLFRVPICEWNTLFLNW